MKILMLVNWKIEYCSKKPSDKQPPDYYIEGEDYWFYRWFIDKPEVELIDIHSIPLVEKFEKNIIRFYIWQSLKLLPKLNKYDLIVSHGMQSGVILSLWRRIFKTKSKHIVFDIGAFASASEKGTALKIMQFSSKSIDGFIYHMSEQQNYYKKFFPWIIDKSYFIPFGADFQLFDDCLPNTCEQIKYIVCVGKEKSDWSTLVSAYKALNTDIELHLIGGYEDNLKENIDSIKIFPYLPFKEYIRHVKGALFCVLPLEPVGFSFGQMRLLQQMAMGKCVVSSRIPSLTDYGKDDETVLFYEPYNIDNCKEKLKEVIECDEKRNRIAIAGRESVLNYYNEAQMAYKIEQVYKTVLEK